MTLLLTDIEGSSQLWEKYPEAMKEAVARHDRILQRAPDLFGGIQPLEQGEGDSTLTAFQKPSDAVMCALEIQKAFITEAWPEPLSLRVRAALHSGEVELRDETRYWGPTINRSARLRSIAHGGQVLLSGVTSNLLSDRLPPDVSLKDMGVHHLKDLSTPEHVFQLCHPDLPADFPPLLSLNAFPNNLPVHLKSFIPREEEMEEIRRRLASHRLVTLTGVGGSGKTRLAIQVAAESVERYPGGVWLVDLALVFDPGAVVEATASAVRVPTISRRSTEERPDQAPEKILMQTLIDYLRARKTLVVLDNCEHLLDAISEMAATLLENCPDLTLLVTSREALGIDGEAPWRIPSLSVPNPDAASDLAKITGYQAVQLFVERAAAARSDFALTLDNAPAVASISRRFDGLPLAIELAAARVNVLSPAQIASMLDDTFRLLAGGSRTALERQQTMRASIDWSFELLTDKEQILLRRLSVFVGGTTLEAVEGICTGDDLASSEILDLLSHLVQKSLIESTESKGQVRYRLLEMIRQYAAEKLRDANESEPLRFRHRDFYLSFVEEIERAILTVPGDDAAGLDAISADHDNLRAAMDWSIEVREKVHALRLASSMWEYWWLLKLRQEAWSWMERVLSMEGEVAPELEGKAYLAKSYAGALSGKSSEGHTARAALEAFDRAVGNPTVYGITARWIVALNSGLDERLEMFDRALEEAHRLAATGHIWAVAIEVATRGMIARSKGALEAARRYFDEAVTLWMKEGKVYSAHDFLEIWPYVTAREQGDNEAARRYIEMTLDFWRGRGDEIRIAGALNQLAYVSKDQGLLDEARSEIAESLRILRRVGDPLDIANVTHSLGEIEEVSGNLDEARSLFSEALHLSQKYQSRSNAAECFWGLARVARANGDVIEAIHHLGRAVDIYKGAPQIGVWVRRVAQYLAEVNPETAAVLFAALNTRAEKLGLPSYPPPDELEDYETAVDKARASIGEMRFSALWEEGRAMDFDEAVEVASKVAEA